MSPTGPGPPDGRARWMLGCECGYVARADDEAGMVADARRHARGAHHLELSAEQILRSARPGLGPEAGEGGRAP